MGPRALDNPTKFQPDGFSHLWRLLCCSLLLALIWPIWCNMNWLAGYKNLQNVVMFTFSWTQFFCSTIDFGYSEALLLVPWLIVQASYLFKFSLDWLNSRVVKLLGYWFNCLNPSVLFIFWLDKRRLIRGLHCNVTQFVPRDFVTLTRMSH